MANAIVSSTRTGQRGASATDASCDAAQPSTSTRHPGQQSKVIGAKEDEPATKVRYAPLLPLRRRRHDLHSHDSSLDVAAARGTNAAL